MTVVLDTNVLMSAFFFGGIPGMILEAWRTGRLHPAASPDIVEEYVAVTQRLAQRHKMPVGEPLTRLFIDGISVVNCPPLKEQVCPDPDDDKFLAGAIAVDASCVISGDRQLVGVTGFRGIDVLTPHAFVERNPKLVTGLG